MPAPRLLHSPGRSLSAVELSAQSYAPTAYVESTEAAGGPLDAREGIGLGALLILLSPLAIAAWFAIGSAVYRVVN